MTERQLELREHRREKREMADARLSHKPDDAPHIPECRVLMLNGRWLIPKSQRPKITIPTDPAPYVAPRGPDQRVAPGGSWGYMGRR